jgi:hypothetical protein
VTAMAAGWSGVEEGQVTVRPAIGTAGVPAAEMTYGVYPGTSVLEGSNDLANWATDNGRAVGRGGGNKAGEAKDILGAIAGVGDSSGTIRSTRGGLQLQSPKPPPQPLLASWASLARDVMARLLLSMSPSLLVGVSKLLLTSPNFLVLVLPYTISYL